MIQKGLIELCRDQASLGKCKSADDPRNQFLKKLSGWSRAMYDMCNDNQVTDVETINQPATIMNSKADQENQRRAELRKRWGEKKKTETKADDTRQMGSSPLLSHEDTEDQIQTPRSVKGA